MNKRLFNNAYVAHELRNNLNVVSAAVQLLEFSDLTLSQERLICKIASAQKSMLRLSENLLGAHEITICPAGINLYRFLVDIVEFNADKIRKKDLDFICDLRVPADRVILFDPLRLEQVIANLLENAIKFTQEGTITFSAELLEEEEEGILLEIAVHDTGIGIAEDDLTRIFDYGVKRDESRGNGIGLYVCNCIALAMDASLSVESAPHQGSTFRFSFYAKKAGEEF